MILYEEAPPREDGAAPAWLVGATDLQRREGSGKRWYGIGSGAFVGPQDQATWHQVSASLRACVLHGFAPLALARDQAWCPTTYGADLQGRVWRLPCVLNKDGDRQFRTAYGPDYLPAMTPEQTRAEAVAKAARTAIVASVAEDGGSLPMELACRWSADLLATVNHISPEVIGALTLLDDALIAAVLYTASGLMPRLEA